MELGVKEYEKRLKKYIKLDIEEVKDEPLPKRLSREEILKHQRTEEKKIWEKTDKNAHIIGLDLAGKQYSSEGLAKKIQEFENSGISKLNFVIGGTLGFSAEFKESAHMLISLSKLTFPHQIVRLLLLEQLFRAYKINRNEPYHT